MKMAGSGEKPCLELQRGQVILNKKNVYKYCIRV